MNKKIKICVVTGSRAEYGLLLPVMKGIKYSNKLELQTIVTGSHLSKDFGNTYKTILSDGFKINKKIDIITKSDSQMGIIKMFSSCLTSMSQAFKEFKPDLLLILGDRYEIYSCAIAAMFLNIPVAHISGGDIGGSIISSTYDNVIRHNITKISSLHFVTHKEAKKRVIQLGENPSRVFCFGSTCVENILNMNKLTKKDLENKLSIKFKKNIFVLTFHPITVGSNTTFDELNNLLIVMKEMLAKNNLTIIFTKSNFDNGGRKINLILKNFVNHNNNSYLYDSLGSELYFNLVNKSNLLIGNSSSGIYESAYLKTPFINIGDRQASRKSPKSVINCNGTIQSIRSKISQGLKFNFDNTPMIYGKGNTSKKIIRILEDLHKFKNLSVKHFTDIDF